MIKLNQVNFSYEDQKQPSLKNINLEINKGEVILFCGESGCGKTTLTRLINGLIPHFYKGTLTGTVQVNGHEQKDTSLFEISKYVGSVFQNPRSQFFNINTLNEMAFASENHGVLKENIENKIEQVAHDLNITPLLNRNIFKLSGGEKQKIACGSVSVSGNDIYVLDEPSSNLDNFAVNDLKNQISYWKEQGKTVVIAEHRLYFLKELVDRVFYLKDGQIVAEYTQEQLIGLSYEELKEMGLRPLSLKQVPVTTTDKQEASDISKIKIKNFSYTYKKASAPSLNLTDFSFPKQSVTAIIGANGAGKSTFARCLCGLEKKFDGKIKIADKWYTQKETIQNIYLVMQDVNHQLFTESVLDEVLLSMKKPDNELALSYLTKLGIENYQEMHPLSLSGGQKQRVAIASALASKKECLIFDEPTSGLDLFHMKEVSTCIKQLSNENKTCLVVSHDFEFIASCCDYVIHIDKGELMDHYSLDKLGWSKLLNYFIGSKISTTEKVTRK